MIGVVVVAHLDIGLEMVKATQNIIPEAVNFKGISVQQNEPPASIREKIEGVLKEFNRYDGVLILTDMFGGTPSNVCLSFLSQPKLEVVSGVNLPMLIKLASYSKDHSIDNVIKFIQEYGQKNIVIASHILDGHTSHE
ncbi:MAG: PTS sugar transporter subunit IIA [Pseudomonadota bacterium]